MNDSDSDESAFMSDSEETVYDSNKEIKESLENVLDTEEEIEDNFVVDDDDDDDDDESFYNDKKNLSLQKHSMIDKINGCSTLPETDMHSFQPSSKQKVLSTKTQEDIKFEKSQLLLLSNASIMKATLSPCCSKSCLVSVSTHKDHGNYTETYELIKACRLELIGLNKEQRTDKIRDILRGVSYHLLIVNFIIVYIFIIIIIIRFSQEKSTSLKQQLRDQ